MKSHYRNWDQFLIRFPWFWKYLGNLYTPSSLNRKWYECIVYIELRGFTVRNSVGYSRACVCTFQCAEAIRKKQADKISLFCSLSITEKRVYWKTREHMDCFWRRAFVLKGAATHHNLDPTILLSNFHMQRRSLQQIYIYMCMCVHVWAYVRDKLAKKVREMLQNINKNEKLYQLMTHINHKLLSIVLEFEMP